MLYTLIKCHILRFEGYEETFQKHVLLDSQNTYKNTYAIY